MKNEEKLNKNLNIDEILNESPDKKGEDELPLEIKEEVDESVKERDEEITKLKTYIESLEEKLLRANAEAENIRRRYEKLVGEAKEYAITNFAKDLLAVMDNLLRALEYKSEEMNSQVSNVIAGVEMTKNELVSIFKKNGLDAIEPGEGEKFDYNLHHAISQIETDQYDEGTIINTMQVGYKIKERLLRPAIVKVAKKA